VVFRCCHEGETRDVCAVTSRYRAKPLSPQAALETEVVCLELAQPPGDEAGQRRPGEQHDQKAQGL
jgi:hypothetical protein